MRKRAPCGSGMGEVVSMAAPGPSGPAIPTPALPWWARAGNAASREMASAATRATDSIRAVMESPSSTQVEESEDGGDEGDAGHGSQGDGQRRGALAPAVPGRSLRGDVDESVETVAGRVHDPDAPAARDVGDEGQPAVAVGPPLPVGDRPVGRGEDLGLDVCQALAVGEPGVHGHRAPALHLVKDLVGEGRSRGSDQASASRSPSTSSRYLEGQAGLRGQRVGLGGPQRALQRGADRLHLGRAHLQAALSGRVGLPERPVVDGQDHAGGRLALPEHAERRLVALPDPREVADREDLQLVAQGYPGRRGAHVDPLGELLRLPGANRFGYLAPREVLLAVRGERPESVVEVGARDVASGRGA